MGNAKYCLTKADLADAVYASLPVDKQKAATLLTRFVAENPKTIREKVEVICEHLPVFFSVSSRS